MSERIITLLMLPTEVANPHPKRKRTLFPGISSAADEFGVHRVTLYRVLMGQIPDHQDLERKYKTFINRSWNPKKKTTPTP